MTDPLVVLHVHSGNLYGGVETILLTLAKHLGPMRHVYALSYEGRLAGYLRGAGAPVEILGEVRFRRPWTVLPARHRLERAITAHRPDVVMCHSPWGLAAFGPIAKAQGTPLVLWAHAPFRGHHWLDWLSRLAATPDFVACNSEYTRSALHRSFPNAPSEVVYPPVARPPAFDPARRPTKRAGHGAEPGTVVLTMAARLEPWKGHRALLDALSSIRELPGWTAWIVGGAQRRAEDVYRADLERRTNEARIADRVHFLGQRDDVAALLWASDVYCQPNSGPEPFGVSLVEALYAGLPIVTTALGGAKEIVTPECGVLVPPGDPRALADALRCLITDSHVRSQLAAAAPQRAAALCDSAHAISQLAAFLVAASEARTGR